jgi:hypothetical protein
MLKAIVPSPTVHRKRRACLLCDESAPHRSEDRGRHRFVAAASGLAGLLLPNGDDVQAHAQQGRALHHLDQLLVGKVGQQGAAQAAAADHAQQQHHVHQRHHARARLFAGQVGGQCQAGGLRGLQAGPDKQEGQAGTQVADPGQAELAFAGEDQQRKGHDRQPAELQHRADPDIGHAAPADGRRVGVRAVADECPEGCGQQRQRDHQRHQPGGHVQLDDHHAVERANHQRRCQAHRHLEQGQAQQPRQRQPGTGRVGKGQHMRQALRDALTQRIGQTGQQLHRRTHSMACDL